jgi:hypothetical protein
LQVFKNVSTIYLPGFSSPFTLKKITYLSLSFSHFVSAPVTSIYSLSPPVVLREETKKGKWESPCILRGDKKRGSWSSYQRFEASATASHVMLSRSGILMQLGRRLPKRNFTGILSEEFLLYQGRRSSHTKVKVKFVCCLHLH